MKYELITLEQMLSHYFIDRDMDAEQETQKEDVLQFDKEVARIENVFLSQMFFPISDMVRKRYVRHHQQRLQFMEEKIQRYVLMNANWLKVSDAKKNYDRLQQSIGRLLSVIETHYAADMLLESVAPASYNMKVTEFVKENLSGFERKMEIMKVDQRLSNLLMESLEQFVDRKHYTLSCYGQLYMIRQIVHDVLNHEPNSDLKRKKDQDRWLIELLCSHNFNRLSFYSFCKEWIVQHYSSETDKLYLFTRCGKFFSRLTIKKNFGWNLQRVNIVSMLSDYFRDSFLAEKRRIQQEIMMGKPEKDNMKLSTNLTVEQLGLFIRVLCESDVLKTKSVASVVRFFARHMSTIGKEVHQELSYDYLKNAYTKSSIPVIEKVDEFLQNMSTHIRKIKLDARRKSPDKT